MTELELVSNIIALARGGGISDDERLSEDQVSIWMNYYRARLLKEYYQKGNRINSQWVQDLGCLKLICVDAAECCNAEAGETILRTEKKIPQMVELPDGEALVFVGLIDKRTQITLSSASWSKYLKHSPWTGKRRRYFTISNYIYIDSIPGDTLEHINVRAVLLDPKDAALFTDECGVSCYTEDEHYPIPAHMIQIMTQMILERELNLSLSTMQLYDDQNDGSGRPRSGPPAKG